MRRRVLLILGIVLVSILALAEFSDVPKNHWAYESVKALADRGLLLGYPDGTFKGNRALTRYEFAVFSWRLVQYIDKTLGQLKAQGVSPADFERLSIYVEALSSKLGQVQKQLEEISKTDVSGLQKKLDGVSKDLAVLKMNDKLYENDISELYRTAKIISKKVKNLESSFKDFSMKTKADILSNSAKIKGLSEDLETVKKSAVQKSDLERVNVILDVLSRKMVDLEDRVSSIPDLSGYEDLKKTVKDLKEKSANFLTSDEYYNSLDYIYSQITDLQNQFGMVADALDVLREDVNAEIKNSAKDQSEINDMLNRRMNAQDLALRKLNVEVSGVKQDVASLKDEVGEIAQVKEEINAKLAQFEKRYAYKEDTERLDMLVETLAKKLGEVYGTVRGMKEDLTKLSSLSAEVEGLKSKQKFLVSAPEFEKLSIRVEALEKKVEEEGASLKETQASVKEARAAAKEAKAAAKEAKAAAGKPNTWTWISLALGVAGVALGLYIEMWIWQSGL